MITQRFVDEAGELLLKYCPLASENPEMMEHIKGEIEDYDEKFSHPPSSDIVLRLAMPLEVQLKNQAEAKKVAESREAAYANHTARLFAQEDSND